MDPGLEPPDTPIAAAAQALCVESSPVFLANHAVRSYAWGCLLARIDDMSFDREVLYVASLLHDLGLTDGFDGPRCFELSGADAARDLAKRLGWDPDRAFDAAEAIRLHMQPRVIREDGPEAYLLSEATSYDVSGRRFHEIDAGTRELVLAAAPRVGFKEGFTALIRAQVKTKPDCMANHAVTTGMFDRIAAAPFDE